MGNAFVSNIYEKTIVLRFINTEEHYLITNSEILKEQELIVDRKEQSIYRPNDNDKWKVWGNGGLDSTFFPYFISQSPDFCTGDSRITSMADSFAKKSQLCKDTVRASIETIWYPQKIGTGGEVIDKKWFIN